MSQPAIVNALLRVIYGDTDQMGVVYYANYFRFFEFSRNEWFRARGGSYVELEKLGFGLPVVSAHCDYQRPAKYDDVLRIEVQIAERRRASLRFGYVVRRDDDGTQLVTGTTLHACVGPSGKPTGLPDALLRVLDP